MWLTRFAIERWVITLMLFIALVLFGLISFFQIGRSSAPPGTNFPVVVVFAGYPGASPQDMERMVIKPIEDQMVGIENLDELDATAQEGSAVVVVQFKMGTDINLSSVEVQRRVDTARIYMPPDMNPPVVSKGGNSEPPILDLAISSKSLSQTEIADLVNNKVSPMVQAIPNVQTVNVYGTANREFHVLPLPGRLYGTNATLSDVFNAVANNNLNVPGGLLTQPTREATVSVHSYIEHASDILGIPLTVPGSTDKNLNIGDVATATDSHVEMRTISSYNGLPRVYMQINPTLDADQVSTTATVRAAMKKIEAQFPRLSFTEIDAPADNTQKELAGVGQSLIEGIILTAIVMLLFLHAWRNAVVVFLAIPTSIFSTFILMKLFGFHIDDLSMMGLSLIIGILVDDSIVVLENITRHRDMGENALNAAINGRSEIGSAAIAITTVDVVVFLPIAFLPGIVGAYLKEFAAVVVIATLFSLLVSFTLTPLLAARWSVRERSEAAPAWLKALDNRVFDAAFFTLAVVLFIVGTKTGWFIFNVVGVMIAALLVLNAFVHRYDRVLDLYRNKLLPFGLAHGALVVWVCFSLFVLSISLAAGAGMTTIGIGIFLLVVAAIVHGIAFLMRLIKREPWRYQGNAVIEVAVMMLNQFRSIGTGGKATIASFAIIPVFTAIFALGGPVSTDFMPAQQNGSIRMSVTYPAGTPIATTNKHVVRLEDAIMKLSHLKSVSSTVGQKPSGFGNVSGGNYATLNAQMDDGYYTQTNRTIAKIRKLAYLVPGAELDVAGEGGGGGGGPAIFYALTGPDGEIGPAAEKVAKYLRTLPGAVNIQTSAEMGAPRLDVNIDRAKCALLGVSPAAAADVARIAVDGAVATRVRTDTGLVEVRVQFPAADRNTVDDLKNVRVRAQDGTLVPLGSVADFVWTTAPTKIERLNRQRVVNVLGDVLPGYSLGQIAGPLQRKLKEPGFLPPGVGLKSEGNSQFMDETFANMGIALVTSFVLVYMLMVILYGSFLEPLIVMFSVPLAIIGALFFLAVMARVQPQQGQSLNIISMLGIVMLFGLVAKNGILLVDYSNTLVKRGMRVHEAVLQAASTRFRPIIMTTAAMIFGMLPLSLGYAEGGEWRQAMGTVIIGGLLSSLILTLFLVPMIYTTWMGYLERRADRRAVKRELEGTPAPAHA